MNQDEQNHFDDSQERKPEFGTGANARAKQTEHEGEDEQHEADPDNAGSDQAATESDQSTDQRGDADEELARMKEAMLRLKAEMDNREKRLEREMTKTRKFALEALMRDLVQVLDSMDQALSSASDDQNAPEGMHLVRKQALQVLSSHGLEMLDPQGEKFDPSWHEAMATQPSEEVEPDTVVQVLQKGYRLNERLIRPARVIVATHVATNGGE